MTKPLTQTQIVSFSVVLTIGSLLFIILLFISYFSKKSIKSIRNTIYKYLLIVGLVLIVTEIMGAFILAFINIPLVSLIMYKIHWSTGIVWFSMLYYYSIVFLGEIEVDSLSDLVFLNKKTRIYSIIFLLSFVLYFFLPFDLKKISVTNLSYFPGLASYFVTLFSCFASLSIVYELIKNRKTINIRKRIAVLLIMLDLSVTVVLQARFVNVAIIGLGITIQMFFLYFNIENPELFMINELEKANNNIEKSNRAKSDFLSNMSHEIRTPMNAIVGFSEALLSSSKFEKQKVFEDIKHIESAGNSLLDIINNILDISKIETGKDVLNLKEYSIRNMVLELESIIKNRISDKKIDFIIEVDSSIPNRLYGDSTKIYQVLLNILTNSVKYTEVGKIILKINGEKHGNSINLQIEVSDTGYGIKKEDYDKVFKKFSRLEDATENEIEGSGLGLVITKRYVELMGGKIWFESEYKVGTTFYVDITQKIVDSSTVENTSQITNTDKEENIIDCSKYKVLIVDDNELNLKVASRLLSKYKFQIETSNGGKDCIYKIKSEKHYDIIFLDHMMPDIDGIEVLHILRKLDGYEIPPVVALTANAISGMKEMYLKEGFDEYLSKPINIMELNKIILKYFDK